MLYDYSVLVYQAIGRCSMAKYSRFIKVTHGNCLNHCYIETIEKSPKYKMEENLGVTVSVGKFGCID